jgi:hypothetical protein
MVSPTPRNEGSFRYGQKRFHVEHRAKGLVSRIVVNAGRHQNESALMMWKDQEGTPAFPDTSLLKDIVKDTLWISVLYQVEWAISPCSRAS